MSKVILQKSEINFEVKGTKVSFTIIHNLPKVRGLCIEDAISNWSARTKDYSSYSLVGYIMGKNHCYIAMTEAQYGELNKVTS